MDVKCKKCQRSAPLGQQAPEDGLVICWDCEYCNECGCDAELWDMVEALTREM